jgi:hypothetical protein
MTDSRTTKAVDYSLAGFPVADPAMHGTPAEWRHHWGSARADLLNRAFWLRAQAMELEGRAYRITQNIEALT